MREATAQVQVPRGTGIDGFLATMRKILKLPRVLWVNIDTKGLVRYARVVRDDEEATPVDVDFPSLTPFVIIRGSEVRELEETDNAAVAVCNMLAEVTKEMLYPIAFATSPQTTLWEWFSRSCGVDVSNSQHMLCGFPVYYDDQIPEYVLVLCAGYHEGSEMSETRKCFKITMPEMHHLLEMFNG